MMYSDNRVKTAVEYDSGLRDFMLGVFNNMSLGLAVSAIVALVVASNPALLSLFFAGPQKWVVILAPLAIVFFISFKISSLSPAVARVWFYVFAAVMGLSLSTVFVVYKAGSIATVFFATAGMFGAMSIYGYTTKRNLTSYSSFFMMALWGLIIAMLINLFVQSSAIAMILSMASVLLFAGLTAYDVQMLQQIYYQTNDEDRERAGILGALALYLDFINIFLSLLQLMGEKE